MTNPKSPQGYKFHILLKIEIPNPPRDWRNMWRPTLSQGMLPSSPSIQGESHLDGRGRIVQAHGRGEEYRVGGRRSFQNYQGRKGALIVLKE